jgi:hypothetical protein
MIFDVFLYIIIFLITFLIIFYVYIKLFNIFFSRSYCNILKEIDIFRLEREEDRVSLFDVCKAITHFIFFFILIYLSIMTYFYILEKLSLNCCMQYDENERIYKLTKEMIQIIKQNTGEEGFLCLASLWGAVSFQNPIPWKPSVQICYNQRLKNHKPDYLYNQILGVLKNIDSIKVIENDNDVFNKKKDLLLPFRIYQKNNNLKSIFSKIGINIYFLRDNLLVNEQKIEKKKIFNFNISVPNDFDTDRHLVVFVGKRYYEGIYDEIKLKILFCGIYNECKKYGNQIILEPENYVFKLRKDIFVRLSPRDDDE